MRAFVLIRDKPFYRRDAFTSGLKAAGFDVLLRGPDKAQPGDLLCQWNRYATNHEIALRFEREGGRVIVAENGYLNADGSSPKFSVHPHGPKPTDHYAIGLGFHNDSTRILPGGPERWQALGIELKPWRTEGDHILICPNRSFGVGDRVMRADWAERTAKRLRKATKRPVRIRPHPGNDAPKRGLYEDLKGAWAVVIWSSSCGVHALVEGIPVFCEAPYWICKGAAASGSIDDPIMPDRLPHFERMACGQWTCDEITRGEPFKALLAV